MRRVRLYNILQGAHISEKANMVADKKNCFTFKVLKDATVGEIKEAVETIYEVPVSKVTVANVKGKVKRNARGITKKPSWKKAYVSLPVGHEIEFS